MELQGLNLELPRPMRRWLAPEVMQGEHATQMADVFSMGVVLWELLT